MGNASAKTIQYQSWRLKPRAASKKSRGSSTNRAVQANSVNDEVLNTPSPDLVLRKRGPGRPKIMKSDGEREKRRREQLRIAQDAYRARKQNEYSKVKDQNKNMQNIATTLGANLVELLNRLAAGNALEQDHALAQNVAVSVRDMLDFVKVLQVDTVGNDGDGNGKTAVNNGVPPSNLTENDAYQNLEHNSTHKASSRGLELDTSQSRGIISSQTTEGQSATFIHAEEIDAFNSSQPGFHQNGAFSVQRRSPRHHQPQYNMINLQDWFSAKSLLLDRALDPYNLYVYKGATLAKRIEHSALVRAGWLPQDPTTTMDLVYKIFPFDKSPAPPHIQLFKIKQLISRSHPNLNRQAGSTFVPGTWPRERMKSTHVRNFNNLRSVQWGEIYPPWLTSHDVERYLVERWNVAVDSDYVRMPFKHHGEFAYQQKMQGAHTEYSDFGFQSMRKTEAASIGLVTLRLKAADLIEGFIQNGICLEAIPAFERAEVDRVINKMVQNS